MNTVPDIAAELDVLRASPLIDSIQIIVQSRLIIKARIYIAPDLFVQIYRNDRFQTTNSYSDNSASLAAMNAMDNGIGIPDPIRIYTMTAPKVANRPHCMTFGWKPLS